MRVKVKEKDKNKKEIDRGKKVRTKKKKVREDTRKDREGTHTNKCTSILAPLYIYTQNNNRKK